MSIVVYVYRLELKVSLYLHNIHIKIFRQYCHFLSAKIMLNTELSNFMMKDFGNIAVFFSINKEMLTFVKVIDVCVSIVV